MKFSIISDRLFRIYTIAFLLILPGCGRIMDWGYDHFYQGEKRSNPKYIVRSYIRDVNVYYELETAGLFTSLWLSDAVRCSYASLYATKCAKTEAEAEAFVNEQLHENERHISFYVMSLTAGEWELNDRKGYWMIWLEVDGKRYFPVLRETAELNAEYTMFLSKVFDKRRKIHMVKFNAFDQGKPIITKDTQEIKLVVSTLDRKGAMTWSLDKLPLVPHPLRCLPGETAIPRRELYHEDSDWV